MEPYSAFPPSYKVKLEPRFWEKVAVGGTDECWPWRAYINPKGYGSFEVCFNGRAQGIEAQRLGWQIVNGDIPVGATIDHLCRNRACVNPAHMEAVSTKENVLRGVGLTAMNKRKTHCPNGHPYSHANTHVRTRGSRECRTCIRERATGYRVAKRSR